MLSDTLTAWFGLEGAEMGEHFSRWDKALQLLVSCFAGPVFSPEDQ